MVLLSTISPLADDSNLNSNTAVSATEHNTHRTNYRDNINNQRLVLIDLEKNYAGTSAPGDTPAGKWWYDTNSPATMKYYTGSAWEAILSGSAPTFTGNITASAAALTWTMKDAEQYALTFESSSHSQLMLLDTRSGNHKMILNAMAVFRRGDAGVGFGSHSTTTMTVESNIGTGTKIRILSLAAAASELLFGSTLGIEIGRLIYDPTNKIMKLGVADGSGSVRFYTGGSFTERVQIDSSGKVGFGVSPLSNMAAGDLVLEGGSLVLKEITTPTADTNYGKLYTKSDNALYFQDGAGVEHTVTIS